MSAPDCASSAQLSEWLVLGNPATNPCVLPNTRTYGTPSVAARSMKLRASFICASCVAGFIS